MRSLARALIVNEKIHTTEAKAKALRPYIEKIVTKGRKSDLATRRSLLSVFYNDNEIVSKIITEISPRYKDRPGGYTRIVKTFSPKERRTAIIEFVK